CWGMFGIFKSKEQKSGEKFWKSEMGQRLTAHNAQYFGPGKVCEGFSPEGKQKFCEWLLQRIFGVYQSANPFAAMRMELAAMVLCHSELLVLLKNDVKRESKPACARVGRLPDSGGVSMFLARCSANVSHAFAITSKECLLSGSLKRLASSRH